ncbi:SWI/SNF-related matrix-associated actin-dependent regulator of chromatin subfamily A containing DEAD/H box 1 homolog [Agrilus planipennis]|uniref:SWI/SNF-related matrix-associated actin-dependent regulator of chromatin subfamily A containing DEAD/H box 1 homolog n=1 Tax=Agrilus planipennis TaxID=224129 RepID=A0A7F5RJA6_AGRPL|nr:SWI/SNF-related matrix-associated actin-dependent regulator of chromatin subfamily A containing DEAD/H box 1 homolog [Agrilus planipennis]
MEDYTDSNILDESDERVLNFFQNATFEELKFLNTNPDKGHDVAEKIYGLRPFANWSDLELQLKKSFPHDMVAIAKEMFNVQLKIDQILERTKTISEDVKKALQKTSVVTLQPKQLLYLLKKCQVDVLNWMMVIHKENVNGILNYPLGSGRMLQLIAFFSLLKERKRNINGLPHLVIVPSNIVDNWVEAFKRYCPSMKVFVYHGSKEERTGHRLKFYKGELYMYDVILTTYTVVVHIADEREVFRSMTTDYVVFDETDTAKNINIQLYDNLIKTRALRRLLITTGSLQGNPLELMSVLYFIMPSKLLGDCYLSERSLQKALRGHLLEGEFTIYEKKVIDEVNEILEPFILQNLQEEKLGDMSLFVDTSVESTSAIKEENTYLEDDDDLVDTADYVQFESVEMNESYSASKSSITKNQQKASPDKVVIKKEVIEGDDSEWNPYALEDNTGDSVSDFDSDFETVKRRISPRRKFSTSTSSKRKRKSKFSAEDVNTP